MWSPHSEAQPGEQSRRSAAPSANWQTSQAFRHCSHEGVPSRVDGFGFDVDELGSLVGRGVLPDGIESAKEQAAPELITADAKFWDEMGDLVPCQQTFARLTISLSALSAALLLRQRM